ncbi:biotin carboxylase N-terminal domain-containing protein [Roseovarius sp.]|uniref:acetyl-CoA carboxylase biotin carboxylase subunit n=1 Tax=Roseovarius sp. TaxID=1486281 RepID=UPI00260A2BD3|nr:biotin carboxylase N-terminal domain-containing protein [Roseovarius sp.]MDM8165656.1 biotin carboxylase N-terminal domain-containing protein [Roseovarius sp.]
MGHDTPPFKRILIANRGEIACRVIDTCRRLGVETVAVHHLSERNARFVRLADASAEITGDTPVAAYLDAEQIIETARETGAEAIHPGYGFLSENSGFARAVEAAGLVFIGPAPDTIDLMGDKIRSRRFAEENGVPVAPSVTGGEDIDAFVEKAASIGFPLLIKASAGGGGKGMSIVEGKQDLLTRARTARSEAERYFGDPTIYAERYVERPRHIEVQVLGDGQGKVLHLFERECSVQRRFQKIIEEAPAGHLDPALRDEICAAAVRLSEAVAYRNAGTVEFILAPDGTFYFLEMNTRLQVEHPVTEMVTGLDLVALQLDIAAGRGLSLDQPDITLTGHALECRVCAEVPEQDFMPATGRILHLDPPTGDNIRFENGLREGTDVTLDFDSMLAKLVVAGPDRPAAIAAAQQALERTVLLGVETNINYLARILAHPAFRDDPLHTGFVAEHEAALAEPDLSPHEAARVLMAAALTFREFRTLAFDAPEPYASIGGWRN